MAKKENKAPPGNPTSHTPEIAEEICSRLAGGELLKDICADEHIPHTTTIHRWVVADREGFRYLYARARQMQALGWAEDLLGIADGTDGDLTEDKDGKRRVDHEHIQRSRLRVDTRKWLLSKVLPKIYGDKLTVGGDETNPLRLRVENMTDEELAEKANQITNRLKAVKGNGDFFSD